MNKLKALIAILSITFFRNVYFTISWLQFYVIYFYFLLKKELTSIMDLTVIFLFTTGIVMIAAGDVEDTTLPDIKEKLNKTNTEDNELDTGDDFEPEERPTHWHRWFRYRRPVDFQIRVP